MERRTVLALAAAGLAGCGSTGSSSSSSPSSSEEPASPEATDPPTSTGGDLSVVGLDTPETVEVTTPYEVGVRVRNPTDRWRDSSLA